MTARHRPVLLAEMLSALQPMAGELIVDGTFGAGGYARALLDRADVRVLALDRDPGAVRAGRALVARYAGRLELVEARFGEMEAVVRARAPGQPVHGVVLDIGVSSMQLDEAQRGFSFQADGPLDMRMGASGPTAADAVNELPEKLLADVLLQLGEEPRARAIARAIVGRRAERPFARTGELAGLVAKVAGRRASEDRHPATRSFQALRLYVNDELGELARGLAAAERLLAPGGRLVVVSFHSLEDRIVKRFLRSQARPEVPERLPLKATEMPQPRLRIVARPVRPTGDEVNANPRARSAILRVAEKLA
jgi:16S rRNA (cytosine1402-N4)-methyltransferase